jgi:MFS family permease
VVRRLRLLISAIVIVDTMLYAALVPLLPHYVDEYGLSKAAAGVLVAAYAAGVLAGAVPGGLVAARFGPKTAVLGGLVLTALASVVFGFSSDALMLGVARLVQGLGSALSWAGALAWLVAATPRERRGEMLGGAIGAAVFGALLGPVLGAVATETGPEATFAAVAAAGLALAVWAARSAGTAPEPQRLADALRAAREPVVLGALWLMVLPALLFGTLAVLVPLRLDDAGWSGAAIGAVFLVAAAFEIFVSPLAGRLSDRHGRLWPVRIALGASIVVSVALAWPGPAALSAALVVAAALAYGAFFAPAMALLADGAERLGIAQGLAFGLMNGAWALGNAVGPSAGGGLGQLAGDAVPFSLGAGVCAVTAAALWHSLRESAKKPLLRAADFR